MYPLDMERLNYQHLERFWAVVREGGVTRASQKLHVSQPTVSAQVRALETALGRKLFARSGRGLVLTDFGRTIYRYADEIFGLGRELMDTAQGRLAGRPLRLAAGVANVVPKLIACRILEPALKLPGGVQLECLEDTPEQLLAQLALHHLDVVLADAPVGPTVKVRAFNHLLGECGVSVLGRPQLARAYRRSFPRSLDGAPFLLPRANSALRRSMEDWFDREGVRPRVVGSFDDSALLKAFGQVGAGLFAAPTAIEAEVCRQYDVRLVGRLESVREQFYVITVERTLKHPAVVAISEIARRKLFMTDVTPRRRRA
jgi:LysR family transcriptional activator of nhaA